jgi:hypothetical protein
MECFKRRRDPADIQREILRNSTPQGFREYFLKKANGDPIKAAQLEAQLDKDIQNDMGTYGPIPLK